MISEQYEKWYKQCFPQNLEIFNLIKDFEPLFTSDALRGNVHVGNGWIPIVRKAMEKLAGFKNSKEPLKVVQVKEKFGTLRIYINFSTDQIQAIITEAETEAGKTCEHCGTKENVQLHMGGWHKTLCDSCQKIRESKKG